MIREHRIVGESRDFGSTSRSDPTVWKDNIVIIPNAFHKSKKEEVFGADVDANPGPKYIIPSCQSKKYAPFSRADRFSGGKYK